MMMMMTNLRETMLIANLRGITSVTELSRSNAKVDNLWIRNDISVKLLTVQLINPQ